MEIITREKIVAAMKKSECEIDMPVTDKVSRAIKATIPDDFSPYIADLFHLTIGHVPGNQEWMNFLSFCLISKSPWTPDPVKVHSLRRLRVLELHASVRQIYEDNFIGDQLTIEVAKKLVSFTDYCKSVGLQRADVNQFVLTIAQQEQIPIFGVILSLQYRYDALREKWPDEVQQSVNSWLLYHKLPSQRFRQLELI